MRKIVWYQFSDLHFRSSSQFDRSVVLDALWNDISTQMAKGLVPNFVTVTGDIVWSGQDEEFALADEQFFSPLLGLTGVERADTFLAPGNHDLDREALSDLNPTKIAELIDRERVNAFQENSKVLKRYLTAFDPYKHFEKRFGKRSLDTELGYNHFLTLSGIRVAIVSLNTAWTSGYDGMAGRGATEQGHLMVGERQLRSLLPNPADADLVIALMHHPVSWLADFDRATIEPILAERCDIVLHGHVHRPSEIAEIKGLRGSYLSLGSGASYERRVAAEPFVNSYSIVEYDPDKRLATLTLRKYADSPTPKWTSHEDPFGEGSGGKKTFPVPEGNHQIEAKKRGAFTAVSYGSVGDIYRSLPSDAQYLLQTAASLKSKSKSPSLALSMVFEEVVISWANSDPIDFSLDVVASILLSGTILTLAEQRPEPILSRLIDSALAHCRDRTGLDRHHRALERAKFIWLGLISDFETPPHILTQDGEMSGVDALAVAPILLALSLLLLSDAELAAAVTEKQIPIRTESGEIVELGVPRSARMKGSVVSISVVAPTLAEFSAVSIIRQYIDLRIDQIIDVFSAVNEQFPISALTLHFIERPEEWSEHRFSVDPTRVMRLLMGDALYGKQSGDVWFRELLQNAVDATGARSRLETKSEYTRKVTFRHDAFENHVVIHDNGIGMTGDHIVRFFCKAGRSIWRSEELKAYTDSHEMDVARTSIGKFGVGVLSMFHNSERIRVNTRFFRETEGSSLQITNLEQPFFLQRVEGASPGTEIALTFKSGYVFDLRELCGTYLTYAPTNVLIEGIGPIPMDADAALDAMIARSMRTWEGSVKTLHWEKARIDLPTLDATLRIAIPLSWSLGEGAQDRPRTVDQSRTRVSNGGITVLEKSSLWLGEPRPGNREPQLEVAGLHILLDFTSGAAPVTVSRNTLALSESDASAIIGQVRNAVIHAWRSYAVKLFQQSDEEVATRRLLKTLCNSAKPAPYWVHSWSEDSQLASAAGETLLTYGVIAVEEGGAGRDVKLMRIADLSDSGRPVSILSEAQRDNQLIHLYASKVANFNAVYVSNQREIALLAACNPRWSRLSSDDDLWAAMRIEEDRSSDIGRFLPPDIAVVSDEYFLDDEQAILILATRRERADVIQGLSRADARHIRPRVLLNGGHSLIKSIEAAVATDERAGKEVRRAMDFLIAGVVEEKTKARRSHRLKSVLETLAAIKPS